MSETTIETIETKAKDYAARRELLGDYLSMVDAQLTAIKKKHLKELKRRATLAAESKAALQAAIESAPDLFAKPKTQIFHGIKVGYRKGKGKIEWEDDAVLVSLIKKRFPDDVAHLILTTEVPSKEGLQDLDASDLRKLGVTIEETGEQVVIKPVETEIEKLVKAILKGAQDHTEDE